MKKFLKFEVEEGSCSDCDKCPFGPRPEYQLHGCHYAERLSLDCDKYDLSTLKVIEDAENS